MLVEGDSERPTVFVGDSLMDLEPMLLADVGIVIGRDKSLISFMRHCKIQTQSVTSTTLNVAKTPQPTGSAPLLLTAQSWDEIGAFLLGSSYKSKQTTPRVLIVAGSDSGGGAGIQADLKTCMALGAFGTTAIAAITSQNTVGVQAVHPVPLNHVESQLDSILSGLLSQHLTLAKSRVWTVDIGTDALKTGMLSSVEVVQSIARKIIQFRIASVVIDPVMVSTSGDTLSSNDVATAMVEELFPLATVVTPNIPEAQIITGNPIASVEDMKAAAKAIHAKGPSAVLIKGGHLEQGPLMQDVVYDGRKTHVFVHKRLETDRTHGTGCTLASAIASNLAQDYPVLDAIQLAIHYVHDALSSSSEMQVGAGKQQPFNHGYRLHQWPSVHRSFRTNLDLSLYAITDHDLNDKHNRTQADAVRAAIDGGVTMIQIREKNADGREFLQSVKAAMEVAREHSVPVIVNDRVDVAIAANADGVHLGQADLPVEEVRRMLGPDKIVGVSTKTPEQAIAAEAAGADYLGVGAVFTTQTKSSSVVGLEGLRNVCASVKIPVVAIGGIHEGNAPDAIATGAQGIALITAIFDSSDVCAAASNLKRVLLS